MSGQRKNGVVIVSLLALALLAVNLSAQTFTATLNGRVVDSSGGAVAGAKVTIRNVATNQEHIVTTGTEGSFVFPLLPAGEYALSVEATGFKKETRSGIVLQVGQQAGLEVKLFVGQSTEVVEVREDLPLVQSENAALGGVVEERQIANLPLNLRNFLGLAQLQPNVFLPAQGSTLGFRGGFNVAGNSEIANNFLLDGIDNLDETTNQPNHTPVLDAVREFRVLTGIYAAEYGRQSGGQVIVSTKSGTNKLHGSAFEFHRNSALDAQNCFAPRKPAFRRHQFGGTIGGPIRRNKLFFFGSYAGLRSGSQSAGVASVPSLLMHNGNFSELLPGSPLCGGVGQSSCVIIRNPRTGTAYAGNIIPSTDWSSAGKGLLDLYPTANLTAGKLTSNLPVAAVERVRLDQFSIRLDYQVGAKTTLFGSYNFADSMTVAPILNPLCGSRQLPGYGCDEPQRTQHLALVLTHTFSPRFFLEARVGYNRFGFFRLQEDRTADVVRRLGIQGLPDAGVTPFNNGAPAILPGGVATLGGPTNLPQGRHDNTYHYIGNVTFIRGVHTFKTGVDIRRFLFNSFFTQHGRGLFRFNGGYTRHSVADLLLGLPSRSERSPGEPFHNAMTFSSGYYFQDDWKVNPSLTLNLGIRYELNLPVVEKVNKLASFDPATNTIRVAGGREALPIIDMSTPGLFLQVRPRPDVGQRIWDTNTNNFAPRVGFAWKPWGSQRWVVRGGYGIYYNLQIAGNGITPLSRGLPFRLRQNFDNRALRANGTLDAATFTLADAFSGTIAGSLQPPAIDKFFRTAYMQQWSLGVQRELTKELVLDLSYLGSKGTKLPAFSNLGQAFAPGGPRPFAPWGDIIARVSGATSSYNGLQVRLEKRFSRGLGFLSSYTWSKSIDNAPGVSTGSDASNDTPQNSYNLHAERGRSDFDIRHRYVFSSNYELPFGRGRRFLSDASTIGDAIFAGWGVLGILTLQSGSPFSVNVSSGFDVSRTFGRADRPMLVGDPFATSPRCPATRTVACWFNPDALLVPNGAFGNFGRNALVGPTLRNLDLGLSKTVRIHERYGIEFRAEFFNVANHPNLGLPSHSITRFSSATRQVTDATLAQITRAKDKNDSGAQRQIQFGLKISF